MKACALIAWFAVNIIVSNSSASKKVARVRHDTPVERKCGVCPTYFQKICGFNPDNNKTYIFDNYCIMTLYNCLEGTHFHSLRYDSCVYFGNFAYVHGYKYEDIDYGEDHVLVKGTKKNPYFVEEP